MTQDEHARAFREGADVGRDPRGGAADCPYLPGTELEKRGAWMEGFSSVRENTPQSGTDTDRVRADQGHAPHGA